MIRQIRLSLCENLIGIISCGCILFFSLLISCIYALKSSAIHFPIEGWIEGCIWIDFFLPLFIPLVFSIPFYFKKKNKFINYATVRISEYKYIASNIFASLIATFIIIFITYFLTLLLTILVLYKVILPFNIEDTYILQFTFGNVQAFHPILFGIVWCSWKGIIVSLFTLFGMFLSLYVNNVFIISILPFIYCMAENLFTALLGLERFSILTSLVLNRLSSEASGIINYVTGAISFIIITGIIVLIFRHVQRKQYEIA